MAVVGNIYVSPKTQIAAYHRPSETWRWASLSSTGPYNKEEFEGEVYARVDPKEGESLSDFDIHIALNMTKWAFEVSYKLNVPVYYS